MIQMKHPLFLAAIVGVLSMEMFRVRCEEDDGWFQGIDQIFSPDSIAVPEPLFLNLFGSDDDLIVDFMLYTRKNRSEARNLRDNEILLDKLDGTLDMKIIVHGWRNGYDSPVGDKIKEAYLDTSNVNVIVVDWSSRSYMNYASSRLAVSRVAQILADKINKLVVEQGVSPSKIHIVGHSLGAHVAGIAGLRLPYKIARVTGLDPAAPMFTMVEEDILKPESADFVDVIHTCGYMLGLMSALGHVDFYPNKGIPPQPGCGFDYKGECSHSRAYELFAESIRSKDFVAVQCEDSAAYDSANCSLPSVSMGEFVNTRARGHYYLDTGSSSPFATGVSPLDSRQNRRWLWLFK